LGRSHSWFVCFAPAEHPRIAVAVVVENVGYGATFAAPIARDVLATALQDYGS
jgi:cell division protein FtsI/penicillin-binding protein 2